MPIRLDFDERNGRTICLTFKIPWTWDELTTVIDQVQHIVADIHDPVHIILDVSAAGHPPLGALQHLSDLMEYIQPLRGKLLVVGADRLTYSLLITLTRVSPHARKMGEILFFETVNQAKNQILMVD